MQPIPAPHLLDPDRVLDPNRDEFTTDHESRAEMYKNALQETCEYAQQLWKTLDAARGYLMHSLPPDPRTPEADRSCASPAGPDDDAGWNAWIDTFSAVTSVLCGPHGDSGYGYGEARRAAQLRRDAPVRHVAAHVEPTAESAPAPAAPAQPDRAPGEPVQRPSSRVRLAATGALVLLAARGLLPRRGSPRI